MQDYQRLLASAPTRRLNPSKLAESSVLKNKLVQLIQFLENLAVKDSAEKDAFFRKLPSAIPSLPVPVAQKKLLPMLSSKQILFSHKTFFGSMHWAQYCAIADYTSRDIFFDSHGVRFWMALKWEKVFFSLQMSRKSLKFLHPKLNLKSPKSEPRHLYVQIPGT